MRESVKDADILIGRRFPILDHGYVELIDYMGSDKRIADCARQSYGKCDDPHTSNQDEALVRRLIKNGHSSPFEQAIVVFKLRMPIFVARQWIRHRTARLNEISARYTKLKPEFFKPSVETFAIRSDPEKFNIQSGVTDAELFDTYDMSEENYAAYEKLISFGIAPELARTTLPVSAYTEFYWQIDLNNLMHFFGLRLEEHAQREVTMYASLIFDIVSKFVPYTMKWFIKERFDSMSLNRDEIEALSASITDPTKFYSLTTEFNEYMALADRISEMVRKFKVREYFGIGHGENPVIEAVLKNPEANIHIDMVSPDGTVLRPFVVDGVKDEVVTLSVAEYASYRKYLESVPSETK